MNRKILPMGLLSRKSDLISAADALAGRSTPMPVAARHFVNGATLMPPFPAGTVEAQFGMGCFWGAERLFWKIPGVVSTSVGYAGGIHA
jgi:peptide-methionine (S)-S-oxide reductase